MPFDKVAEMMEELLSVQTNEETVRRHTEQVGSWMEAWQTAEVEAEDEPSQDLERPMERCVISSDGAMVSLVHKQWAEVRTVAIGEPQKKRKTSGVVEIHVGKLSYFSRLTDASTFARLAEVEIRRRRVREAKEVAAVMDGADWGQTFTDRHRPDAVRILDFPHGGEHLNHLLEALESTNIHFPPQMLSRCLHILKHRGPRPLLRMANRLGDDQASRKEVREHLEYLRKREALMQYPQFQRDGWPIGSGMVESANKNVVEARLKGTGMHWQRKNVNPMLTLRNAVCNNRWKEMWQKAVRQYRKLRAHSRSVRAEQRAQALVAAGTATSAESPPQSAADASQIAPPVTSPMPEAPPSNSARVSTRYKRRASRKLVNTSHQRPEACHLCGTPLVQPKGHRSRQYCSDRCRLRAHRKRQRDCKPERAEFAGTLPASSCPIAHPAQIGGTDRAPASACIHGWCDVCGTPLVQPIADLDRKYCSDRCRLRAYRERDAS